jgi:hypothetical protein
MILSFDREGDQRAKGAPGQGLRQSRRTVRRQAKPQQFFSFEAGNSVIVAASAVVPGK